jgi:outer membrane murein-binding lipoprotein Lpp
MMRDHDRARHELLARLEEILGPDQAATLMENLPPRPWSELATKDDVGLLAADIDVLKSDVSVLKSDVAVLKSDVSELKSDVTVLTSDVSELRSDMSSMRIDVDGLRTEMRAGFAHLGEVLDLRFATQDARFESFVRERVDAQTKLLVFALIGTLLTTAGIAFGSVAL